jgi:hypothetical protein
MVTVMDMTTGKIVEDEFGAFEDEVLNAGWLPPSPELPCTRLELQETHDAVPVGEADAETFLNTVYRSQG